MWQMIASTARNHGLRVDREYDGRLSPADSTAAALSYLRTLHGLFGGEWRASAMGYNAGEYRILRAFRAAGNDRVSGEHRLPRGLSPITYDYVAKLHALACLISKPERAGLVLPDELEFRPLRVEAVPAGARSLDALADGWQVPHDRLRRLNPAFRQGRIPRGFNGNLLVPGEALAGPGAAVAAATGDPGQAADPQPGPEGPEAPETHTVGSGDTLWGLSRRYGVSLGDLLRWNRLGRSSVLRIGQVLRLRP
jgi:membrane-bound lytic murein transglycosylase D